jgi:diguanylate cyclase (GGDEF)-like protein/PAS domain S-box-containing protein
MDNTLRVFDNQDTIQRIQTEVRHIGALFEHFPDAMFLIYPHQRTGVWQIVDCNPAASRMYRRSREDLTTRSTDILNVTPEIPSQRLSWLKRGEAARIQHQQRRADQTQITVESLLSLIQVAGVELVLRLDRDISGYKQNELNLLRRIAIEQCATAISRHIIEQPVSETDRGINYALANAGAFIEIDRISVFEVNSDSRQIQTTYEWCAENVLSLQLSFQNIVVDDLPWLMKCLFRSQSVSFSQENPYPLEAKGERYWLSRRNAQTILAVPLFGDGKPIGFLACESAARERSWTEDDVSLLQMVSDSIGRALDRRRITMALQASELRYRMLATHATDMISLHDIQGYIRYCSPAISAILGYQPEEVLNRNVVEFIHPEDCSVAFNRGKVHDSGAVTTSCRLRHRDGRYVWIETSARTVVDSISNEVREIVAVTRDIAARKAYEDKIEHLAYYDPLTNLTNRRRFYDLAQQALDAMEQSQRRIALLYLDLDHFKKVNDTLGHDAGDELLIQVANRLNTQVGTTGTLARLGGDEFAVLIADLADDTPAALLAQRIVDQVRMPFEIRQQPIHIGGSIGIAISPEDGLRVEDLLKHADIAMYRAKQEGDTFRFYDAALSPYTQERLQLEAELRQALQHKELVLYYQPIRDLRNGELLNVEALIRWNHPTRGLLSPGDFILLAEENGLIRQLDRYVIHQSFLQVAEWANQGLTFGVSINLSVRSLQDRELFGYVQKVLKQTGAPPELITIEITESSAMHDPEATRRLLERFKQLGMRLALDDFGSGHASLTYLKRLPVDSVKIDRTFIEGIGRDPQDEGLVRAILVLVQSLNMLVVAEGVNTDLQRSWLLHNGCFVAQGFNIGRPTAAKQLIDKLQSEIPAPQRSLKQRIRSRVLKD